GRPPGGHALPHARFARIAVGSHALARRPRPPRAEEAQFLGAAGAGRDIGVSYADLERAPAVLLAGFEPEDESPIVFLRLRKAARGGGIAIYSLAPYASRGLAKVGGVLLPTVPGGEADLLARMAGEHGAKRTLLSRLTGGGKLNEAEAAAAQALAADGAGVVAGRRPRHGR